MKNVFRLFLVLCFALASSAVFAQDVQTKGSIGGTVTDANGASVPGATVTVTGALGARTTTSDTNGQFDVENLIPGNYEVKVTNSGFKTAHTTDVGVEVGKRTALAFKLEPGDVSATVEVAATGPVDIESTATSANLGDQLFNNIPVPRGVASLFYLAPGTTDSLGGGAFNPSISGGSSLDNLYVADGVNITDSAFGGIGTFSRSYGGLGTGITTSFVKEVQVKTAGFEAQYGQSEGGVVNIITQSGSNDFHGAIYGYMRPHAFEATRKQPDTLYVNKIGEIVHQEFYDAGVDAGGAILKNKLFFFGSYNPSIARTMYQGAAGSGLLTVMGVQAGRSTSNNYAGKLDWNINANNSLTFSIFGDPTTTNVSSFRTLNIDNTTALSQLKYGSRNMSLRYNGQLTPTLILSASFAQNNNHFDETGFADFNQITDRTQPARGNFVSIGLGFVEPTNGTTRRFEVSTSKTISSKWLGPGSHTGTLGYQFQKGLYSGTRDRSGPHYPVPAANATGDSLASLVPGNPQLGAAAVGQTMNATWAIRTQSASCTLCPIMDVPGVGPTPVSLQQTRGEYGSATFNTHSLYNAFYGQDVWHVNKYITANLGLRSEQERVVGLVAYSFTDQWAPRVGVSVDPMGRGKTKVFLNYGRFFEFIPLDEAERSLSSEQDFTGGRFAPAFTTDALGVRHVVINSFGTVTPVVDAAHFLSGATGGVSNALAISAQNSFNPILPGTKLGFADEYTVGFEQQLPHNFVLSARYINRKLKRITEDAAVVAPEDASLFGQAYFIGNISAHLDAAVNPIGLLYAPTSAPPAGCFPPFNINPVTNPSGAVLGAVCYQRLGVNGAPAGDLGPDGVPDGFPDAVHKYWAVEIELNRRFTNGWQLLSNYRLAKVIGNYEGHFRNDNGQTDPGISSLFDFTEGQFNLLGDQFAAGPLNTDRRHIVNIFGSYEFPKARFHGLGGLNIGPGFKFQTGVPISQFNAHPVYLNAGEIPVGGRGALGRTVSFAQLDMHVNYPWQIKEKMTINFVADFFNIFNTTSVRLPNQNFESTAGQNNPDFLKPALFYLPFNMRLGVRFQF